MWLNITISSGIEVPTLVRWSTPHVFLIVCEPKLPFRLISPHHFFASWVTVFTVSGPRWPWNSLASSLYLSPYSPSSLCIAVAAYPLIVILLSFSVVFSIISISEPGFTPLTWPIVKPRISDARRFVSIPMVKFAESRAESEISFLIALMPLSLWIGWTLIVPPHYGYLISLYDLY